jgi:hypothetical protein
VTTPSFISAVYSFFKLKKCWNNLVALFIKMISRPPAMGSSVPACPILFKKKLFLSSL